MAEIIGPIERRLSDKTIGRLQEVLGPTDVEHLQKQYASDPVRFVREMFDRYAPDAGVVYLAQVEELEKFVEFRSAQYYLDKSDRHGSPCTFAYAERLANSHNKNVLNAQGKLFDFLEKLLAHVIGQPVQKHEVGASVELTETAAALQEFGHAFLTSLHDLLLDAATEDPVLAPGRVAPLLPVEDADSS
jgi:hypothetical protein